METKCLLRARSLGMNTRAILELNLRHVYSGLKWRIAEQRNLNTCLVDIITPQLLTRMIFSDTQAFPIKGDFFLFCLATELFRSNSKIISR